MAHSKKGRNRRYDDLDEVGDEVEWEAYRSKPKMRDVVRAGKSQSVPRAAKVELENIDWPRYEGLVLGVTSQYADVEADGTVYRTFVRGSFRDSPLLFKNLVAVGDRVRIAARDPENALLLEIKQRKNEIVRPSILRKDVRQVLAANIDRNYIVAAVKDPPLRSGLIDRLLVWCEKSRIEPVIVFNKIDLLDDVTEFGRAQAYYERIGYRAVYVSAETGVGIDALREDMRGRLSIFTGHSGVGKSSLLNALEPGLGIRINAVSDSTGKGQHTTTTSKIYTLSTGARVIDTPGIRAAGVWEMHREELAGFFPEFQKYLPECAFGDCTHRTEPECAIRAASETGAIEPSRYQSYLNIYESLPCPPGSSVL